MIFGQLRKGDCMCPQGILCDILDPQGWDQDVWHGHAMRCDEFLDASNRADSNLKEWVTMNDAQVWRDGAETFEYSSCEIAEFIENNLLVTKE